MFFADPGEHRLVIRVLRRCLHHRCSISQCCSARAACRGWRCFDADLHHHRAGADGALLSGTSSGSSNPSTSSRGIRGVALSLFARARVSFQTEERAASGRLAGANASSRWRNSPTFTSASISGKDKIIASGAVDALKRPCLGLSGVEGQRAATWIQGASWHFSEPRLRCHGPGEPFDLEKLAGPGSNRR